MRYASIKNSLGVPVNVVLITAAAMMLLFSFGGGSVQDHSSYPQGLLSVEAADYDASSYTHPDPGDALLKPPDLEEPHPPLQLADGCIDPATGGVRSHDREFQIVAIPVTIFYNQFGDHDPEGLMYVMAEEEDAVRAQERLLLNGLERLRGENIPDPRLITDPLEKVSPGLKGVVLPEGTPVPPGIKAIPLENGNTFVPDLMQPLVIRANIGECVKVTFKNKIPDQHASMHIHKAMAFGANPGVNDSLPPAEECGTGAECTREYHWLVDLQTNHYFHSHGDPRFQIKHGLWGVLSGTPACSAFHDPVTGMELLKGWRADIRTDHRHDLVTSEAIPCDPPSESSYREFMLGFHDRIALIDRNDSATSGNAQIITHAPDKGGKGINYRSEPFDNRLLFLEKILQEKGVSTRNEDGDPINLDESLGYNSYPFGDPAAVVLESYLCDPVKIRILHGGGGEHHDFHLHGGGIRWRFEPNQQDQVADAPCPDKLPAVERIQSESTRVDSQQFAPSEDFDLVVEGGSGGVQRSAGDFLFHCHFVEHYVEGMWGFWRVFNTQQTGELSNSLTMLPLQKLPRRPVQEAPDEPVKSAFHSVALFDQLKGEGDLRGTPEKFREWVESLLPPPGVPKNPDDASVWDWTTQDTVAEVPLYLGEPDENTGIRPPVLFARTHYADGMTDGRLAFPLLRTHLGQRPSFGPGHGPAPFLGKIEDELHPQGICPAGAPVRRVDIVAVELPIIYNEFGDHDPGGQIFVLKEDLARDDTSGKFIRGDPAPGETHRPPKLREGKRAEQLVVRANVGDCMDITLIGDFPAHPDPEREVFIGAADMHIHLVQFDIQGSDGIQTGFNFNQTVRQYTEKGETLEANAAAGDRSVRVRSVQRFHPGVEVGVGMEQGETFEFRTIKEVQEGTNTLVFEKPLEHPHGVGEILSNEFVRYLWYGDVDVGKVFFHDHAFGLHSFRHGATGSFVVEPPLATYHDTATGEQIRAGTLADIHVGDLCALLNPPPGDPGMPTEVLGQEEVQALISERGAECDTAEPPFIPLPDCGETGETRANRILRETGFSPTARYGCGFREFILVHMGGTPLKDAAGNSLRLDKAERRHAESRFNPEVGFTSWNLRAEPFANRLARNSDRSLVYSSVVHCRPGVGPPEGLARYPGSQCGDPGTPLLRAYVGDPIRLGIMGAAQFSAHVFQLMGHRWEFQRTDPESDLVDFTMLTPSEDFSFRPDHGAGGIQEKPGDYLYQDTDMDHRAEGGWGLFRVHSGLQLEPQVEPQDELKPLPRIDENGKALGLDVERARLVPFGPEPEPPRLVNGRPERPIDPGDLGHLDVNCRSDPRRDPEEIEFFDIVAVQQKIFYTRADPDAPTNDPTSQGDDKGMFFALVEDVEPVDPDRPDGPWQMKDRDSDGQPDHPDPLTIRVNEGKCVEVRLTNRIQGERVGLQPSLVAFDPRGSGGAAIGRNPDSSVGPNETITLRWFAGDPGRFINNQLTGAEVAPDSVDTDAFGVFHVEGGEGIGAVPQRRDLELCNIKGVTQVHVHLGTAGRTGDPRPILEYWNDPSGSFSALEGCRSLSDQLGFPRDTLVTDLLNCDGCILSTFEELLDAFSRGNLYLDVHTFTHSNGEIRGRSRGDRPVPPKVPQEELGIVWLKDPVPAGPDDPDSDHAAHGLWGGLVVEPECASFHHPKTLELIRAGTRADIHDHHHDPVTGVIRPCGPDENSNSSFREFAIFFHDTVPTLQYGVAINYRNANPVGANTGIGGTLRDPFDNQAFQEFQEFSAKGRSAAPIFEAFAGDRVRIRFLQPAFEDHHAFHLNGNRWARENNNPGSNIISTINTGVGTAFNIELDGCWRGRPGGKQLLSGECEDGGAGGPFAKESITQTTDFIFHCHITLHLKMGMWGILRVHPAGAITDLKPLPQ